MPDCGCFHYYTLDRIADLRPTLNGETLHAIGNLELLSKPGIGICGSRNASDPALEWAYLLGQEAARRGLIIVSGYARGVDRQAHKVALAGGGSTIAVLPEGIERFRVRRDLAGLVAMNHNFLAVSMFEPGAPWTAWRAMTRNRLIVALSESLVVVEAQESGGTIDAARKCIKQGKRLWAVQYPEQSASEVGNRKLLKEAAAIPLTSKTVQFVFADWAATSEAQIRQLALSIEV